MPFRRKPRSPPCLPDQQPTSGGRDQEGRRDSAHDRLERASPGSSGEVIFGNFSQTILSKVVCTAINSVSRRPVYSKFHLIRIQCEPHLLSEQSDKVIALRNTETIFDINEPCLLLSCSNRGVHDRAITGLARRSPLVFLQLG